MNAPYFKALLFVLPIGCVAFLPILLESIYYYLRDRAFARRVTVLEELLDSKLRCAFCIIFSRVKIRGTYRGRSITFSSIMSRWVRNADFTLTPAKVPRQKMLLRSYPMVSEHVHQSGERLVYSIDDGFVSEPTILGKAEAIRILDELVDAAEKCERRQN
jgi:hypothetical protein